LVAEIDAMPEEEPIPEELQGTDSHSGQGIGEGIFWLMVVGGG